MKKFPIEICILDCNSSRINPYLIACGLGPHAGNPRIKRYNIIVVVSMRADETVRFHGGRESNRIGVGLSPENLGQSAATKSLRTGEGAAPGCKAASRLFGGEDLAGGGAGPDWLPGTCIADWQPTAAPDVVVAGRAAGSGGLDGFLSPHTPNQ